MPLWDLLYFLTAALALVDGASSEAEKEEHFVRLHRGELPSSRLLFEWTRRVAEASASPPEAVGALATLRVLWLAGEDSGHAQKSAAAGADLRRAALRAARPSAGSPTRRSAPGWDRWQS